MKILKGTAKKINKMQSKKVEKYNLTRPDNKMTC